MQSAARVSFKGHVSLYVKGHLSSLITEGGRCEAGVHRTPPVKKPRLWIIPQYTSQQWPPSFVCIVRGVKVKAHHHAVRFGGQLQHYTTHDFEPDIKHIGPGSVAFSEEKQKLTCQWNSMALTERRLLAQWFVRIYSVKQPPSDLQWTSCHMTLNHSAMNFWDSSMH